MNSRIERGTLELATNDNTLLDSFTFEPIDNTCICSYVAYSIGSEGLTDRLSNMDWRKGEEQKRLGSRLVRAPSHLQLDPSNLIGLFVYWAFAVACR